MGKRASLFECLDCRHSWWEWFEWLSRADLMKFCEETTCPECGGVDWRLTDASQFSGGPIRTRCASLFTDRSTKKGADHA